MAIDPKKTKSKKICFIINLFVLKTGVSCQSQRRKVANIYVAMCYRKINVFLNKASLAYENRKYRQIFKISLGKTRV